MAGFLSSSGIGIPNSLLPSIFLTNLRSLSNKLDELHCLINTYRDCRDRSAYFITETWLNPGMPDSAIQTQTPPPPITLYRSHRDFDVVGKKKGGDVCFLVNDFWVYVKVLSKSCTSDMECLVIKCRPYYSPREFTSIVYSRLCTYCQKLIQWSPSSTYRTLSFSMKTHILERSQL